MSIEAYYSNVNNPSAFTAVNKLTTHSPYSSKQIRKGLKKIENYTVHRPLRKTYPTRRIYAKHINYLHESDLCDMSRFKEHNEGVRFLLVTIDVLSKFAWVEPLKSKKPEEIISGFERVYQDGIFPSKIRTDRGSEYMNRRVQNYFMRNRIHHYNSNSIVKAAIAERFIRTLKGRIMKYLQYYNTFKYVDVLPKIVKGYNRTFHRSIKMRPIDVNHSNQALVWSRLYGEGPKNPTRKPKFRVGQTVRLANIRFPFYKGFYPKYTFELFFITKIDRSDSPIMYELADTNNEPIIGKFYEQELIEAEENRAEKYYHIDKILARRRGEFFVSFKHYPSTFNRWIKRSDIIQL